MVTRAKNGRSADGDPSRALAVATEKLYSVFSRYPLKPHIDGCPCCVHEEDQALIRSLPLRQLTAEDLGRYAYKALFTWGDVDDFRHFLPRLLELVAGYPPFGWIDAEPLLGRLAYADWREWPQREQTAIESFLWLRWNVGLTLDTSEFEADGWLCGVALAGVETSRYIDAWRTSTAPTTLGHIAEFLRWNSDLLARGKLGSPFYDHHPAEANAVSGATREWLNACMADPEFQEQLAAWYQGEHY
jgi:hypothetical protein